MGIVESEAAEWLREKDRRMATSEEKGVIGMYANVAVIRGYEQRVLHSQSCKIREQEKPSRMCK